MLKLWLLLVPFALVVLAAGYDVLRRVIPNWVPVALVAWAVATAALGWHPQQGWLPLLYGFGMALAVALVLYAARSLDGGDVKLLAALGAVLGLQLLVVQLIGTAVAGCVLALVAVARGQRKFPYSPAIALGFLALLVLRFYREVGK